MIYLYIKHVIFTVLFHSVIGVDVLILAIDLSLKHSKLAGFAEVYNY